MSRVTFLFLITAFLTACTLKQSDPQVKIEATRGQEFKVVVPSNPSTGYHWEIVGEMDKSIIEFVSRDYRAEEPVQPGSGGSDIFVFKAVDAGETTITLGYYPPSNGETEPQETKTFAVVVK